MYHFIITLSSTCEARPQFLIKKKKQNKSDTKDGTFTQSYGSSTSHPQTQLNMDRLTYKTPSETSQKRHL